MIVMTSNIAYYVQVMTGRISRHRLGAPGPTHFWASQTRIIEVIAPTIENFYVRSLVV